MEHNDPIGDTRLVGELDPEIEAMLADFSQICEPVDARPLLVMVDKATGALFIEVHILASRLMPVSTIDVPLDPEEQADYRANREMVEDHSAFAKMREDAKSARTFSNLVCEFTRSFDEEHPLKVIGGQHRFMAIQEAVSSGVDEHHGVKLYFGLDSEQRLDVQLISNTNIAVSTDLFDRMTETLAGPQLRNWCQAVGLLDGNEDFADRRARGNPITVRAARSFIINYYGGASIDTKKFDVSETTPVIPKSGVAIDQWDALKIAHPTMWVDKDLHGAGKEFAQLVKAQRAAFATKSGKLKPGQADFAEKALNYAVLSAWAFVAGVLSANKARQKRHFDLRKLGGKDPLNAAALAKGRHKTDPENYRGLGYRTDAKERGRLAELFFLQAEDGAKITAAKIDLAIKKFHAKEARLEVARAEGKAS